jgi:hypothetical protein
MIRSYNQTHIQDFGFSIVINLFKLGSCKFNIIINIINITFKLTVGDKHNTQYSFTEKT